MEENLVEQTENVEQTTEESTEPQKIYSEEELNQRIDELLPKKINRREEKIRRDYESKYGKLEGILKAGLNVDSIEEATEKIEDMYRKRGVQIPTNDNLSSHQSELLATAEANELIETSTIDELDEEMRNLADKGYENMTSREKIVFTKLNAYVTQEKDRKELAKSGITSDDLNDSEYVDFASKLDPRLSTIEKYELYKKFRPNKPKVEPMGSMKGSTGGETGVKEFYTFEEASQFTKEDFDKNPELFKAVENSMTKWN